MTISFMIVELVLTNLLLQRDPYIPSAFYGANPAIRVQRGVEIDFMEQWSSSGAADARRTHTERAGRTSPRTLTPPPSLHRFPPETYPIVTLHDPSSDLKAKLPSSNGWESGSVNLNVGQSTDYTGALGGALLDDSARFWRAVLTTRNAQARTGLAFCGCPRRQPRRGTGAHT